MVGHCDHKSREKEKIKDKQTVSKQTKNKGEKGDSD